KQVERRVNLAPFPLVQDDAKHLPDIFHRLEVIAFVAQQMNEFDDPPALQLLEAGADVGPRHVERFGDLLRVERPFRNVEQRVNLGHGAIDPPARAHLSPVEDELLLNGRQVLHLFLSIQKLQYEKRLSTRFSGPRRPESFGQEPDHKTTSAMLSPAHEPGRTSNIEHPTPNIEWQRESSLASAFGVRCWVFDVFPHRTFWSAGGFPRGRGKLRPWRARSPPHRFHVHLRKISVAFAPRKPKELV